MSKNLYVGEGLLTRFDARTTPNGKSVCSFSVLLPERPPADGQPRKDGTFVPVESWDLAPGLVELLSANVKNCRVFFSGRLKLDRYTDKQGNERQSLKVVADNVIYKAGKSDQRFANSYNNNQGSQNRGYQNNQQGQSQQPQGQVNRDSEGNPMPF